MLEVPACFSGAAPLAACLPSGKSLPDPISPFLMSQRMVHKRYLAAQMPLQKHHDHQRHALPVVHVIYFTIDYHEVFKRSSSVKAHLILPARQRLQSGALPMWLPNLEM